MDAGFVAVVDTATVAVRLALIGAGATAVLTWPEVAHTSEDDEAPAVLFDRTSLDHTSFDQITPGATIPYQLSVDLAAVLHRLELIDGDHEPAVGPAAAVVVTTGPVTDTLKLVDGAGVLTGTADRDDHRLVRPPIAVRLRVLRLVAADLAAGAEGSPTPAAILKALASGGATVVTTEN